MQSVLWKRADTLDAVALDDNGLIGGGRVPRAVYQGAVLNDDCLLPLATHIDLLCKRMAGRHMAQVTSDGVLSMMASDMH